jgi:hypothetical protein
MWRIPVASNFAAIIKRSIIALFLVSSVSCGYYRTTSRTAGDIKRISVPYLSNSTAEPGIEIEITDQIIIGLVRDNTLKVVDEEEADAVLEGSVQDYRNIPFTFERGESQIQAEQYRLHIGIKVSLLNRSENSYIWENKIIKAHGDYYLETTGDQNYENALESIYTDLVEGILSSTVQDW